MSRDAAYPQAKPDARFDAEAILYLDRGKRDVVGIFEHRNLAGAVEGDVELARQPSERPVVENMIVPLPRIGTGIEQLLRINARGRGARDVADVVRAGAARAQSDVLDALDQSHAVFGFDLPDLDVGAGGDVGVAAAVAFGEISKP